MAVSAVIVASGAANADGLRLAPMPTVVPATPIAVSTDWSGLYVGGFYGRASGEMFDIGGPYVLNDGSMSGLFLGYRRDLGDYVVGGEISSTLSMDLYQEAFPTWSFDRLTDLRLTVGREMGSRALVYLAAGYTTSRFMVGATDYTYDGWNLGIGVDVMVSERFFVGGEYVHRSLSRSDLSSWTGDFGTVQLRAGFRF